MDYAKVARHKGLTKKSKDIVKYDDYIIIRVKADKYACSILLAVN